MDNPHDSLHRAANELIATLKLREYQLRISNIYNLYLSSILSKSGISPTNSDQMVIDAVNKVYAASNLEQAEAHFHTLADKFSETLGFVSFDDFKNQFSNADSSMSIDDIVEKISKFISDKENF